MNEAIAEKPRGKNKAARSRASKALLVLDDQPDEVIISAAKALGLCGHKTATLVKAIKRQIGIGTFTDRLNRFADVIMEEE